MMLLGLGDRSVCRPWPYSAVFKNQTCVNRESSTPATTLRATYITCAWGIFCALDERVLLLILLEACICLMVCCSWSENASSNDGQDIASDEVNASITYRIVIPQVYL